MNRIKPFVKLACMLPGLCWALTKAGIALCKIAIIQRRTEREIKKHLAKREAERIKRLKHPEQFIGK